MTMKETQSIINMALRVNGLKKRYGTNNNLPTVFVDYSGHVAWIRVNVFENGYKDESSFGDAVGFIFCTDEELDKEFLAGYQSYMQGLLNRINGRESNALGI